MPVFSKAMAVGAAAYTVGETLEPSVAVCLKMNTGDRSLQPVQPRMTRKMAVMLGVNGLRAAQESLKKFGTRIFPWVQSKKNFSDAELFQRGTVSFSFQNQKGGGKTVLCLKAIGIKDLIETFVRSLPSGFAVQPIRRDESSRDTGETGKVLTTSVETTQMQKLVEQLHQCCKRAGLKVVRPDRISPAHVQYWFQNQNDKAVLSLRAIGQTSGQNVAIADLVTKLGFKQECNKEEVLNSGRTLTSYDFTPVPTAQMKELQGTLQQYCEQVGMELIPLDGTSQGQVSYRFQNQFDGKMLLSLYAVGKDGEQNQAIDALPEKFGLKQDYNKEKLDSIRTRTFYETVVEATRVGELEAKLQQSCKQADLKLVRLEDM